MGFTLLPTVAKAVRMDYALISPFSKLRKGLLLSLYSPAGELTQVLIYGYSLTAGLLLRDPRIRERKKPGQKRARKKFAW